MLNWHNYSRGTSASNELGIYMVHKVQKGWILYYETKNETVVLLKDSKTRKEAYQVAETHATARILKLIEQEEAGECTHEDTEGDGTFVQCMDCLAFRSYIDDGDTEAVEEWFTV